MTTRNPATSARLKDLGMITLSPVTLSDLFFNSSHAEFNEYCESGTGKPNESGMRTALTEDAAEWLEQYPEFEENGVTAEMLAEDFLRRL